MRFPILALLFTICISGYAAKVDSIYMVNSNIITGEVKSLEFAKLSYKVDGMGTLKVEWDKIKAIKSYQNFVIKMNYETIYYGSLDTSGIAGKDLIIMAMDTITVNHLDIISIAPIKKTFWENIDGYASVGFNFTKANANSQVTGDFQGVYRGRTTTTEIKSQLILKNQTNSDPTRKEDLSFAFTKITSGPRFWSTSLSFEQNTELNLKLRTKVSAYVGRKIINSSFTKLGVFIGGAGNNENTFSSNEDSYNAEALTGISFNTYRYDDPELNISSSFTLYQGINNFDRRRFDFAVNIRWEILKDLFFAINLYNNFDSKPPDTDTSRNDYGIVSSIGYSF